MKPNLDRQKTQSYHTTIWKSNFGSQASIFYIFFFHRVKESFSWEKAEKKGDFWHIQAWSQILTGKSGDTTTQIYENQTLAHRNQLEVSMSLILHVQGSFLWENTGKLVISEILMREVKSLQAKWVIIPHHYIQLWHINWPYLNFSFTMWKGFLPEKKQKKWVIWEIFMCKAKSWQEKHVILPHNYVRIKLWSQEESIGYICVFDSSCAKVFLPEKTWDRKGICEILMPESQSWQEKGMILPHH
jgi:hypothetical protein